MGKNPKCRILSDSINSEFKILVQAGEKPTINIDDEIILNTGSIKRSIC